MWKTLTEQLRRRTKTSSVSEASDIFVKSIETTWSVRTVYTDKLSFVPGGEKASYFQYSLYSSYESFVTPRWYDTAYTSFT